MTLNSHLDAAAEAGIVDKDQADRLKRFLTDRLAPGSLSSAPSQPSQADGVNDVEAVRFARGFHDVFLAIGLTILLVGVSATAGLAIGGLGSLVGAVVAWVLAEYYARRRRLVLPSIILAAAFTLTVGIGTGILVDMLVASTTSDSPLRFDLYPFYRTGGSALGFALYGSLGGLAASLLFFARHRLPFAAGLIALTATLTGSLLLEAAAPREFELLLQPLILLAGLTTFCAAMTLDVTDPNRTSLKSDTAFWLHLAAAPMIVHAAIGFTAMDNPGDLATADATLIVLAVGALSLVALIIDRRALLVAGLAYLGIAIGAFVREAQLETGTVLALTLLLLGTAVVLLGTGWRTARAAVVNLLLADSVARRFPPT